MNDYANEIKSRLKMPVILQFYGFKINRSSRIPCPFHNGTDPNCGVKPDYIHCFVCGESSDQISFVQKYFGLSFQEAIKKLNDDFSLGLPIGINASPRKSLDMARKAFQAQKHRQEQEKALESKKTAFWDAYDEFIRLDKQIMAHRPREKCDELHPLFVEALQKIDYAKYRLDCAEEELYYYEHQSG